MRVLVLGGTGFVGRHLVDACLANGDEVTLFCRGLSNPRAFPGLERIVGDRRTSVEALHGRSWDVVLDTSGYEPRVVRASARAVEDSDALYVFVSSISVYSDASRPPDESSPIPLLEDADNVALGPGMYGPLKVACERALETEPLGSAVPP